VDYTVTHATRFEYRGPVSESVMEVRLTPRNDGRQTLQEFAITTDPAAAIFGYVDAFGNDVRHFDILPSHSELVIHTRARVRTSQARQLPERLEHDVWPVLEALRANGEFWDYLEPSPRVPISPAVLAFAASLNLDGHADPLTCARGIMSAVHTALVYTPDSTTVDTPLDTVLDARSGVCQDFTHAALALLRLRGIPARYVSGYLAPQPEQSSQQNVTSHAWIEAWLPGLEWVALDPTHGSEAGERHISVAVGSDYADAAPTRGLFRGGPAGRLSVSVQIEGSGATSRGELGWTPPSSPAEPIPSSAQRDQ
jgi:transglutaminase-like putative cysteine protease